jgi:hypothetical protein
MERDRDIALHDDAYVKDDYDRDSYALEDIHRA